MCDTGQERKVLRLWHALYGLKKASLAWWHTLDESLKELGFEHLKSEAGIFSTRRRALSSLGLLWVKVWMNSGSRGQGQKSRGWPRPGLAPEAWETDWVQQQIGERRVGKEC